MTELLLPPGFLSWVSGRGVSVGMSLFPSIFVVTPPVSQVESFSYNSYDWLNWIFQGKHLKWKVKFFTCRGLISIPKPYVTKIEKKYADLSIKFFGVNLFDSVLPINPY